MIDHRSYTNNLSSGGLNGMNPCDNGAVLYRLSYQVIWELVTL